MNVPQQQADQGPGPTTTVQKRKVGFGLGIGIFLFPLVFSWFLLRKGHSTLSRVLGFGWLVLILIAVASGSDETASTPQSATAQEVTMNQVQQKTAVQKPQKPDVPKFGNGKYLVGKDIQPGLYRVILKDTIMNMGYVERAKDLDMGLNSIIANIVLQGDGYVNVKDTDVALKLQGVEIYPIDLKKMKPNIKKQVTGGMYLVGYDILPGTYKVEVTDEMTQMGYVERARNVSMGMNDIIANEIVQGQGYVRVKDTDFAIRVQGARLTLQE